MRGREPFRRSRFNFIRCEKWKMLASSEFCAKYADCLLYQKMRTHLRPSSTLTARNDLRCWLQLVRMAVVRRSFFGGQSNNSEKRAKKDGEVEKKLKQNATSLPQPSPYFSPRAARSKDTQRNAAPKKKASVEKPRASIRGHRTRAQRAECALWLRERRRGRKKKQSSPRWRFFSPSLVFDG